MSVCTVCMYCMYTGSETTLEWNADVDFWMPVATVVCALCPITPFTQLCTSHTITTTNLHLSYHSTLPLSTCPPHSHTLCPWPPPFKGFSKALFSAVARGLKNSTPYALVELQYTHSLYKNLQSSAAVCDAEELGKLRFWTQGNAEVCPVDVTR